MIGSEETAELPLTAGQLRRFALLRGDTARCPTICCCFRIPGELDIDRLTDSVEILVSRHEALRIEILERPGREPRQRIRGQPPRADLISRQHVLARSEEQFSRYIRHITARELQEDWHAGSYLFRFRLFRYSPAVQVLLVALSHIAVDGIGAEILIRDLIRTYADILAGRTPRGLPRRRLADSVAGQVTAGGKGSLRFVEGDPSDPPLLTRFDVPPADHAERGGPGRQFSLSLAGPELAALRAQASLHGCTEFTWILAAFARTVFRFTRQDRIKISVPVNLRRPAEREVVGMYVVAVSVVVKRPHEADGGRRFVTEVGSALLRAMARYRPAMVLGPGSVTDLNIKYQKMSRLDSRQFYQWGATDYLPRVGYSTRGLSLEVYSYPDVLDVQALLDSGVFSEDSAKGVSETLSRNLIGDSGWERRNNAGFARE
jgi:hypothetical protein